MNKKSNNNKIIGGKGKLIPEYIEPVNSPYQESNTKQINPTKKSAFPEPYIKGGPSSKPENEQLQQIKALQSIQSQQSTKIKSNQQQPLIDLQIYPESTKKPNPLADKQAMIPLQPFALSSPFMPPQFQNYFNNFMKNYTTPFIYKDYNINLGGPNGDHLRASMIYEDALPPADIYSSYKTLRERNSLNDYIRGTFIKSDEGEFVDFKGGPTSLNSRLKLIQLNPYNTNIYSSNPYKGLPNDQSFLIYKSCYPIVHDKETSSTQCNKLSTGMNVRAYKLNIKEFIIKYFNSEYKMRELKFSKDVDFIINKMKIELGEKKNLKDLNPELTTYNFDVWRDEIYYTWIRNKINQQNICPNFVSSYCYFINKEANISFAKNGLLLDDLKDKSIKELLSNEFTNCIMLLLTESPNQNIYQWSSNSYSKNRGIHKMVHSGFKPEIHWKSVIAQMLIIFYTMNKYKFTIREMKIQSNFYIKDLNVHGDPKQFWQYTIGNIDYYIPNYGHLVMLDHNYKELIKPENKNKFRIIMKDEFGDDEDEIFTTIISNAIDCFNPNNFGSVFTEDGGVQPPSSVIEIFNKIYQELINVNDEIKSKSIKKDKIWEDLLIKFMCRLEYIHNRVGTPLRDLEFPYIRKNDTRPRPFKSGELIIWEEKFETYRILLFIKNIDSIECECISKDLKTNLYENIKVPRDLLFHYSELESIKQDGKLGEPIISFEHILERYIL